MFITTPLIGVGAAKFGHYSCWTAANSYPHSTLLQVFAELGLLGGGLFVTVLILALFTLWPDAAHAKSKAYAKISASAFALLCVFIFADQFYGNYFMATGTWLMLGIAARVSKDQAGLARDTE